MLEISPLPRTKKPSKSPMPSKTSGKKRGNRNHDSRGRFA
jgi:hypothetical protein